MKTRPAFPTRVLTLAVAVLLMAGCAEIRERLPSRPKPKPPVTAPAKPRPPVSPTEAEPVARSSGFVVLAPGSVDGERSRVRRALAKSDPDALPAKEVGYYVDVLQARLRQMVGPRARITRSGSRIAVDLSRAIGFAPGASQLGPGASDVVAPFGKLLADYGQVLVTVRVSPVDAISNNNPQLAHSRALTLAQHLADAGVAKRRVLVVGAGGRAPGGGARVIVEIEPIVKLAK